jgi:hypothetical protein
MPNTPAQDQAAITAAIQAAAVADLALLTAFATANGGNFTTIEANLTTLAGQMSDAARQAEVTAIRAELAQSLADFQTLISTTTAAQTAIPVA